MIGGTNLGSTINFIGDSWIYINWVRVAGDTVGCERVLAGAFGMITWYI